MVDHLNHDFDFWIVTRDRDLGDTSTYTGIQPNQWVRVGDVMVYYLSPENCTVREIVPRVRDYSGVISDLPSGDISSFQLNLPATQGPSINIVDSTIEN